MKQTNAERLEKLAEAYSTNADYCRHMAEIIRNPSSKGHWVRQALTNATTATRNSTIELILTAVPALVTPLSSI
jgi:hypothetical protein